MEITKYFNTLKYLKPIQLYGQIRHRIINSIKIKINKANPPPLRRIDATWTASIVKPTQMTSPHHAVILNQEVDISTADIWFKSADKLWLYHLHYFDLINDALIIRCIEENPPPRGCGWEAYTLSLR